ncbi:hypothetical protein Tco_1021154 [Tanacetum coccineum]
MDDPNITMEEYIRLEEEKAHRRGKVYNWETATYGKIWDNEDVHDLGSVETEFPAIVFNDTLTSEVALSCEPTVSSLNDEIDFRISFDDPSFLRIYQNDDIPPWGNIRRKAEGVKGPEWVVRSKSWTTTRNPPYPTPPSLTIVDNTERTIEEERPKGEETTTTQGKKTPQSPTLYHPSKSSSIHINLPFLEAMIHMTKGAKVLKYILSHKEKLEKAAASVKLSEECSAVIQRSLPQKEGDPTSFTLPCISELKPTSMSIQLANRSVKYPIGVCENLLVKINKFISPVNFVVLEMDEDELVL